MTNIKFHQQIETNLLIVKAGIAGLACCVEAKAKDLIRFLISKSIIGGGASFSAKSDTWYSNNRGFR